MSQSRFSIVLVSVSALLRRPLVSRLRPADGERSPWVAFAARGGRFDSGGRSVGWPSGFCFGDCRSASWPSGSPLPLFGMHRFGVAAGRVGSSVFRFGVAAGRVRSSAFRFGVATGRVRSSVFRFGDCHSSGWPSGSPLPFSACAASEWLLGEFVLPPSASEIALGGLAFGLTASAFRHAPFRSGPRRVGFSAFRFGNCPRRVGLRAHGFRFSACAVLEIALGGLSFGLTASAFRHAPLRKLPLAGWFFRLPFRSCRRASWPSGSPLPLFGMRRFGVAAGRVRSSAFRFGVAVRRVGSSAGRDGLRAHCFRFSACTASEWPSSGWPSAHRFRFLACADPHRRAADARADGAHRHDNCFTSKHLSQHVNLPHRTP